MQTSHRRADAISAKLSREVFCIRTRASTMLIRLMSSLWILAVGLACESADDAYRNAMDSATPKLLVEFLADHPKHPEAHAAEALLLPSLKSHRNVSINLEGEFYAARSVDSGTPDKSRPIEVDLPFVRDIAQFVVYGDLRDAQLIVRSKGVAVKTRISPKDERQPEQTRGKILYMGAIMSSTVEVTHLASGRRGESSFRRDYVLDYVPLRNWPTEEFPQRAPFYKVYKTWWNRTLASALVEAFGAKPLVAVMFDAKGKLQDDVRGFFHFVAAEGYEDRIGDSPGEYDRRRIDDWFAYAERIDDARTNPFAKAYRWIDAGVGESSDALESSSRQDVLGGPRRVETESFAISVPSSWLIASELDPSIRSQMRKAAVEARSSRHFVNSFEALITLPHPCIASFYEVPLPRSEASPRYLSRLVSANDEKFQEGIRRGVVSEVRENSLVRFSQVQALVSDWRATPKVRLREHRSYAFVHPERSEVTAHLSIMCLSGALDASGFSSVAERITVR